MQCVCVWPPSRAHEVMAGDMASLCVCVRGGGGGCVCVCVCQRRGGGCVCVCVCVCQRRGGGVGVGELDCESILM